MNLNVLRIGSGRQQRDTSNNAAAAAVSLEAALIGASAGGAAAIVDTNINGHSIANAINNNGRSMLQIGGRVNRHLRRRQAVRAIHQPQLELAL